MAIWSTAGSIISCELPQERKKVAYRLSFVITDPSRATDTRAHTSRHKRRQMRRHGEGAQASTCTFATCAKAPLVSWLSACLPEEVTFTFHVNSCNKYAKLEINDSAAGEQTAQKYERRCSFARASLPCVSSQCSHEALAQQQIDIKRKTECVRGRGH